MIGRFTLASDPRAATARAFFRRARDFDISRPVVLLSHFDADGLEAAAILAPALERSGRASSPVSVSLKHRYQNDRH